MSIRRLFLFVLGFLVAGALLMFVLPMAGVSSSHFLPPSRVYVAAQGLTKGVVVSKYYKETSNPFNVGAHEYFLNYEFRAHTPPARGVTTPGPVQTYTGTIPVDKATYDEYKLPDAERMTVFTGGQVISLPPSPVHVKYEKTYPEINGLEETWADGARNIGPGSALFSGWLIWLALAVFLGYLLMMVFERFGKQENI